MNTFRQTVVPIFIIVLLIGGVTFISQWVSSEPQSKDPDKPIELTKNQLKLQFDERALEGRLEAEMHPMTGSYDFWFKNDNKESLDVGLNFQSCKCSKVEMQIFSPEEQERYDRGRVLAFLNMATPAPGFLPALTAAAADVEFWKLLSPQSHWYALTDKNQKPVVVPPGSSGLVRLGFDGKQPGQQLLKATLWMVGRSSDPANPYLATFELPVNFRPAVAVMPNLQDLGELTSDGEKSANFICWVKTRAGFDVAAKEKSGDPRFVCQVKPLSVDESQDSLKKMGIDDVPRAAYLVTVTVHERYKDLQMDLGPFQRKILIDSPVLGEPMEVDLVGFVSGDVQLLADDKNRLSLGTFNASQGASKTAHLESQRPDLKMEVESRFPEYIQVTLDDKGIVAGGQKQWQLDVKVPPNRASGRLQPDAVVILKTSDTPPRRIRIPIYGNATLR